MHQQPGAAGLERPTRAEGPAVESAIALWKVEAGTTCEYMPDIYASVNEAAAVPEDQGLARSSAMAQKANLSKTPSARVAASFWLLGVLNNSG